MRSEQEILFAVSSFIVAVVVAGLSGEALGCFREIPAPDDDEDRRREGEGERKSRPKRKKESSSFFRKISPLFISLDVIYQSHEGRHEVSREKGETESKAGKE